MKQKMKINEILYIAHAFVVSNGISSQNTKEKSWMSLFCTNEGSYVGYPRRKKREELKNPKPEKKKEREEKRKKKKLARLERQQYE